MQFVRFTHRTYGTLTTTVENFVQYEAFDACDENGDSYAVLKDDCLRPQAVSY